MCQGLRDCGRLGGQVLLFLRVNRLVVQLVPRCLYKQVFSGPQCAQRTETECPPGICSLSERWTILCRSPLSRNSPHYRQRRFTLHLLGNGEAYCLQDGWGCIHQNNPAINTLPSRTLTWQLDNQGHMNGFVVKKNSVRGLSMVSERLGVFRCLQQRPYSNIPCNIKKWRARPT